MILVKNIYYMLSYAFKALKEQGYKNIETENFENVAELLSEILIKGLKIEIKRGLFKNYENLTDTLSTIKGKIDIGSTIKNQTLLKGKIVCNFDEFTENTYLNQIIKVTLVKLLHANISRQKVKRIKDLLVFFNNVSDIDYQNINWKITYSRNNHNYKMIIAICNLILKGLIQTNSIGKTKLMDFIDEQKMSSLYEKFILEYFKQEHPDIETNASFINWQLDDGFDMFLPRMKSDISLSYKNKFLIIDAKYYSKNMQSHFDKDIIISANIYQIFTYVKNKSSETKGQQEVSGMLLYAKTTDDIQPKVEYMMSGNKIAINILNLNQPFEHIKKELDYIYLELIS